MLLFDIADAEQREIPVITGLPIGRVGKYCTLIVELLLSRSSIFITFTTNICEWARDETSECKVARALYYSPALSCLN